MRRIMRASLVALLTTSLASLSTFSAGPLQAQSAVAKIPATPTATGTEAHWPSFHGPQARGVGTGSPPTTWNLDSGENVRWKTEIPGLAHASPVIWGDRIYLTTAVSSQKDPELKVGLYGAITPAKDQDLEHTWWVYALDRTSGEVVWKQKAHQGTPAIRRHIKASHANATPATDGKHVVAFFGSEGLHAYRQDGTLLWRKDFGKLDAGSYMMPAAQWGFANSPALEDGKLIVLADVQGGGFLAVYDIATGRELWKVDREEVPTWTTPTLVHTQGGTQIVVNGFKHMGAYDLKTGKGLWRLAGGGDVPVPRPVAGDELVYITNAHGRYSPIYAIHPDARGDVSITDEAPTHEAVAWSVLRGGAYMQTPILLDGRLYVCRDNGILAAYDAATGERIYRERLTTSGDGFTASGVAADGKLYYPSETGTVFVVKAGDTFELLATNQLDEITMASPAMAPDEVYFRTQRHLIAIGDHPVAPPVPPSTAKKTRPQLVTDCADGRCPLAHVKDRYATAAAAARMGLWKDRLSRLSTPQELDHEDTTLSRPRHPGSRDARRNAGAGRSRTRRRSLAHLSRRPRPRRRCRYTAYRLGHRCWHERSMEDRGSGPGPRQPGDLGRPHLLGHGHLGRGLAGAPGRPLWRHHHRQGPRDRSYLVALCLRSWVRQGGVEGAYSPRSAGDQAPHQGDPRQLDPGHRRRAHRGVPGIRGSSLLRQKRQTSVA
jgi:outer membrane protein assembly factor BamB